MIETPFELQDKYANEVLTLISPKFQTEFSFSTVAENPTKYSSTKNQGMIFSIEFLLKERDSLREASPENPQNII